MGGSGGGGYRSSGFSGIVSRENEAVRKAGEAASQTEISDFFAEHLQNLNDRDVPEVRRRADEIEELLKDTIEGHESLNFGGSVAKRTYVDGLSDIDMLAITNSR